jgi:CBS domain containing-hemolysin-like protein
LRAQRRSSSIPQKETDLLKRINVGLSAPMGARLAELRAKKESSSLTEDENSEYLQIAYQVEELDVQRLEALSELAQIRDVTVRELMTQLSL